MPNILLSGVATLDIINIVNGYPNEDSEIRASEQITRCGGNASNTAIVMQKLGVKPYLFAALADDSHSLLIKSLLRQQAVNIDLCPVYKSASSPVSSIISNQLNGSRSIVHYRDLAEPDINDFIKINLNKFDWLHFEGRNCSQLKVMLEHASLSNIPISIELEKSRDNINELIPYANVLLISRPFAISQNFNNATECLNYYATKYTDKVITCTWGDEGAYAYDKNRIIHQPAFKLKTIAETLAAGDTFNAGFIASLLQKEHVNHALKFACKLASNKCKQNGFDNLKTPCF